MFGEVPNAGYGNYSWIILWAIVIAFLYFADHVTQRKISNFVKRIFKKPEG